MSLLNDELTVWEIGFRWAGRDPDSWWPHIPLAVRDNFRTLMDAILRSHLECLTISLEKRPKGSDDPHFFYIRDDLDTVYECIHGVRYNRKLLKWAQVERWAFMDWCEGHSVPLPEFWFPAGWGLNYQWPENRGAVPTVETPQTSPAESPAADMPLSDTTAAESAVVETPVETPTTPNEGVPHNAVGGQEKYRVYQRRRIACQEIATNLWKSDPSMTIAAMVEHDAIQRLGGGQWNVSEVVRRWLADVAPQEVKARRGRPRKNPTVDK
jgi:hypothetical protein